MGEEAGPEDFGRAWQWHVGLFYVDDRLFASQQTDWLQTELGVLDGLFETVVLCTNTNKTEEMVLPKFYTDRRKLEVTYTSRMKG